MRGPLGKVVAMLLPWPAREHRQAAVEAARAEKERSRKGAADAAVISAAIERLAAQNHFATLLAEQIVRQHRRGGTT